MFNSSIAVLTNSNWMAIWLFFFIYSFSAMSFCFLLSVLFSKANTAAAVSGLLWFISYVPFVFMTINHINIPLALQILACILPNCAMAYGCKIIVDFERSGIGLQWSNFWDSSTFDSGLTVSMTVLCMFSTSVILIYTTLYIEKVFPGEYGVPEDWNFVFKKSFWFSNSNDENNGFRSRLNTHVVVHDDFEPEPANCVAGVKVKNLRKVYENGKIACVGSTFKMFYDQITVLFRLATFISIIIQYDLCFYFL